MLKPHALLLGVALACGVECDAQAIQRKQLVTTFGGGGGFTTMNTSIDSLGTRGAETGSVRLAFAYAITARWSVGVHYDRIGTDRTSSATELLRFTTYLIEGSYRLWIGEHGALEVQLGLGPSLMALKPWNQGLPLKTQSTAIALGVRYMHMISGTIGAFASLDHSASRSANITDYNGQPVRDAQNEAMELDWNSQRVNAGLVVRF